MPGDAQRFVAPLLPNLLLYHQTVQSQMLLVMEPTMEGYVLILQAEHHHILIPGVMVPRQLVFQD
jgi:hypothetical protein